MDRVRANAAPPCSSRELPGSPAGGDRLPRIDALRGFALLGICVVNAQMFGGTWSPIPGTAPVDRAAAWLITALFTTKFYLLFAFLFGYSFVLQEKAAEQERVSFARRHVRRVLGLFLIGLAHAVLLYPGDILSTYAVLGLVLLTVRRLNPRTALRTATALVVFLTAVFLLVGVLALGLHGAPHITTETVAAGQSARYRGDPLTVVRTNIEEYRHAFSGVLVYSLHLLAAVLTGLAAGRQGWLDPTIRSPADTAVRRRRLIAICLPVGLTGGVLTAMCTDGPFDERSYYLGQAVDILTAPLLTAAYAAVLLALLDSRFGPPITRALAPAGRMSLTNYLLQSAVMALTFTGYGLALHGTIGPAAILCGSGILWTTQLTLSTPLITHTRYGPAETLLRLITSGPRKTQ
ncbi:DUF418 domain-containing protein (plasmid) [Streptomyces sp. NBC_01450]|uniref:DUF418 domain-containing protein n=1 Tax=Streptomyces sp. NBC_01450 TaxID=2903871 RepID=UPI002E3113A8|nr:DUF418 domain-containing protein [Streptomyces sp. NBC_01450]